MSALAARRSAVVCLGVAALVAWAGCGGSGGSERGSDASQPTIVSYSGVQEPGASGYAAAVVEGYFADEGLRFSPTWGTSGAVILQGLLGGTFDVANVGPAQLYGAIENGACARVLRPTVGAAYGVISQPELQLDASMPYPEVLTQLRHKAVGVPARGAAQELVLRRLLKEAGVDPDADVTWLAIGSGATAAAAFASGEVDAAMSTTLLEVSLRANETPFDKLLSLSGSDSPLGDFWQAVAVANCAWADDHPETVLRFCHALDRGYSALANDPSAGPKALAYLDMGSDLDESTALWASYKTAVLEIPPFDESIWNQQARFTPDGIAPDFSRYVVRGCATA